MNWNDDSGAWLRREERTNRALATILLLVAAGIAAILAPGCAAGGKAFGLHLDLAMGHPRDLHPNVQFSTEEIVRLQAAVAGVVSPAAFLLAQEVKK